VFRGLVREPVNQESRELYSVYNEADDELCRFIVEEGKDRYTLIQEAKKAEKAEKRRSAKKGK
jgi:hypothetical protein